MRYRPSRVYQKSIDTSKRNKANISIIATKLLGAPRQYCRKLAKLIPRLQIVLLKLFKLQLHVHLSRHTTSRDFRHTRIWYDLR